MVTFSEMMALAKWFISLILISSRRQLPTVGRISSFKWACYKNNEEGFYEMKLPPQHDLSSTQQIAETNFEIKQKIVAAHWHALMEMLWRMYFGIISTLC